MSVKDLIQQIRMRPEMFVGSMKLEYIYHYINGFLYNNIASDRVDDSDYKFKNQFHEWVQKNIENCYGVELEAHRNYVFYISRVCDDEKSRVEKFFELCDVFFHEIL